MTIRENSLGSINEAIKDGAEIVEIDVMLTADGIPVLMHDTNGAIVVKTNEEGEWAKYEVNIPKSGLYKISGRVSASVAPAGIIRLEWDGDFSEEIEVENTMNTL